MRLLWYPKEHFRLRVAPEYMFEGTNRMRIWDFHQAYLRRPGFSSDIAEYTARDPNPFDYDAVIFSKGGPSPVLTRWLRKSGILVVWDQCDPVERIPAATLRGIDLITTNSDELKASLETLAAPAGVTVIYDPHEADLTHPSRPTRSDRLRVTWFGWGHNFRSFVKPLLGLLQSLEFVEFAWAGADKPENRAEAGFTPGIAMGMDPGEAWTRPDSWLNFIRESDVGIVPVFGQIKPQHKALNYMAYGVPVVCSPTDAHRRIVRHGENGYLAGSEADWRQGLTALRDPDLRQKLGDQARQDVGASRSAEAMAEKHYQALRQRSERTPRPAGAATGRARAAGRAWYPAFRRYQRWREARYLRQADWPI